MMKSFGSTAQQSTFENTGPAQRKQRRQKERSRETDGERPKSGAKERCIFPDNICNWEADFVPVVFSHEKRGGGGGGGKTRGIGGHCWVVTSVFYFTDLHRSAHRHSVTQSGSNWCPEKPCETNQGGIQVHVCVLL